MYTIKEYMFPQTIKEAYELLVKKKNNTILGGGMWLKMGRKSINTAIDLSGLCLSYIKENKDCIEIGSMTTLREIEESPVILGYANGILKKALGNIVGVQFRNSATLGGSIFSRFGFSDILTAMMAFDAEVELYQGGRMPLSVFNQQKREKDILIKVIIQKEKLQGYYETIRNSATDFPVIAVAVTKSLKGWRVAVGARPSRAKLAEKAMAYLSLEQAGMLTEKSIKEAANIAVNELSFATDMRTTREYREQVCRVLIERGIQECLR